MKKIMSLILTLTLLLPLAGVRVGAERPAWQVISKIGNVELSDAILATNSISYIDDERDFRLQNEDIEDEDMEFLLEIFSDENLVCVDPEIEEEITYNDDRWPHEGGFSFTAVVDTAYSIHFNRESVLVCVADTEEWVYSQGLFKFKSDEIFEKLMSFLEEKDKIADEKAAQREEASMKNKIAISDFKIIYTGVMNFGVYRSDGIEWGVCSYIREGETEPVTRLYYGLINLPEIKDFVVYDSIEEYNTVPLKNHKRMITVKGDETCGYEYDCWDLNQEFKAQVNVKEDMTVENITVTYKHINRTTWLTANVNMDTYKETGTLPREFFSVENNYDYTGEENNVKDFTKIYTETLLLNSVSIPTIEWGVCSYSTSYRGKVVASYIYLPQEKVYLLNGYKRLNANEGLINALTYNQPGYRQALIDGKEVFDYEEYDAQMNFKLTKDREIYDHKLYINSKNIPIASIKSIEGVFEGIEIIGIENQDTTLKEEETTKKEEVKETEEPKQEENKTEEKKEEDSQNKETEKEIPEKEENKEQEQEKDEQQNTEAKKEETEPETEVVAEDFIDVPKNHWAYDNVKEFSKRKIVLGYGNGYFGPDDAVTYEHFGLLLDRMFEYKAENTEKKTAIREYIVVSLVKALELDVTDVDESIIEKTFTDCYLVKAENRKYIAVAIEKGLVEGYDGRLSPKNRLTRAETVTLLARAEEL